MIRRGDDATRVRAWLDEGRLVRPREGVADLVDLVRAVAAACGVDLPLGADARRLAAHIGTPEHLVFVLVDGLGSALQQRLSHGTGFLAAHTVEDIHAVFPSTTAAALTSLATGEPPAAHGIVGWWTRLPECGCTAEVLPFVERFTKRPLADLGVGADAVLPAATLHARLPRDRAVITRDYIAESTYSRWWAGGAVGVAYHAIEDVVDLVARRVRDAPGPTWTHVYLNQLDALCHEQGIGTAMVGLLHARIDAAIAALRHALPPSARLVVTADHGHVDATEERLLRSDDALARMLACPPTGEPRAPVFHLAAPDDGAFADAFRAEHGDAFALLTIDDAAALGLFGDAPLSARARARFGDRLALAPGSVQLLWHDPARPPPHRNRGVHGGLTPEEMVVPFIMA